jgi:hypothetical protein
LGLHPYFVKLHYLEPPATGSTWPEKGLKDRRKEGGGGGGGGGGEEEENKALPEFLHSLTYPGQFIQLSKIYRNINIIINK